MQNVTSRSSSGFTLLETVVATGILVTALAGIAQLFVLSGRITSHSELRSSAVFAAQAKMESLRALTLGYTAEGGAITDPELEPSPPESLFSDFEGYSDYPDDFVRRWAITPLDDLEPDALVIEVCVFRAPADDVPLAAAESCLATVRPRQP